MLERDLCAAWTIGPMKGLSVNGSGAMRPRAAVRAAQGVIPGEHVSNGVQQTQDPLTKRDEWKHVI